MVRTYKSSAGVSPLHTARQKCCISWTRWFWPIFKKKCFVHQLEFDNQCDLASKMTNAQEESFRMQFVPTLKSHLTNPGQLLMPDHS